jgi:hypothetical protein
VKDFKEVSKTIDIHYGGIYIAYPTSEKPKRGRHAHIAPDANWDYTKIGTAVRFTKRRGDYMREFNREVDFYPVFQKFNLGEPALIALQNKVSETLVALGYKRVRLTRDWFHTTERQAIAEVIWKLGAEQ